MVKLFWQEIWLFYYRCGYQYEHTFENSETYAEGEKSSELGSPKCEG